MTRFLDFENRVKGRHCPPLILYGVSASHEEFFGFGIFAKQKCLDSLGRGPIIFYLRVAEEGEGDSEARALALGAFDLDIALV